MGGLAGKDSNSLTASSLTDRDSSRPVAVFRTIAVDDRNAAIAVGCSRALTSRFLPRSGHPGPGTLASPTAGISCTADIGGVPLCAGILKVCCSRLRTGALCPKRSEQLLKSGLSICAHQWLTLRTDG